MKDNSNNKIPSEQLTCKCQCGQKVRGKPSLIGKTVRCPRCHEKFVFGYFIREKVTDTAVVRLLGDAPEVPPIPEKLTVETRKCERCGVEISPKVSVCDKCQCYVGSLPDFFGKLSGIQKTTRN
ncbi:MAG: hypothetical protein AAF802_10490 [Planctomycetota bacterium]